MFLYSLNTVLIVLHVLRVLRHDIKDINEHLNVPEKHIHLAFEVVQHELVLPAAVPEREAESAEEADFGLADVGGEAETHGVLGHEIGEDDASHGGLACAAFAHQQHLAILHRVALHLLWWR